MIDFHALLGLLPATALTLVRPSSGGAPLSGEFGNAVVERFRQFRADLDGDPQLAEQIYRIVNSTITT